MFVTRFRTVPPCGQEREKNVEVPFRSSFGPGHRCQLQRGGSRGRMRSWLASRSLWWLPTQSPGRCGSSGPGRRGAARSSRRRGAARSRVPLRHRVAVWTLPRLLTFPKHDKNPARAGLFLFLESPFRWNRNRLSIFDLTRFLDANRPPPTDQVRGHASLENALNNPRRRLTSSNDDDASSGGANDGGDASPNTCDANGGGPSPSAGGPSPDGPSRDDGRGHGPSALLRA
jgi:hypothetical protein